MTEPEEKVIHAPATYAELSKPFESLEAINDAWLAFQRELYELRKKHRIQDLTVICEGSFLRDGEAAEARVCSHYGSSLRKLPALAYAYGESKAEQEKMLSEAEQAGARRGRLR
jgi:hypothetical protein